MSQLLSVVPSLPSERFDSVVLPQSLPGLQVAWNRFLNVLLTAVPLILADAGSLFGLHLLTSFGVSVAFGSELASGVVNAFGLAGLYITVACFSGVYPATGCNPVRLLRSQVLSAVVAGFVLLLAIGSPGQLTVPVLCSVFCTVVFAGLVLPFANMSIRNWCSKFDWWGERAIVVGVGPQAISIFEFLKSNTELGLRPVGYVDDLMQPEDIDVFSDIEYLGNVAELPSICRANNCHWVVATLEGAKDSERKEILNACTLIPNLVVVDGAADLPSLWADSFDAAGLNGLLIRDSLLRPTLRTLKRLVDIIGASVLLMLASPLLIAIAVLVKILSPGPILFGSERIGRGGHKFKALKFRSMVANADVALQRLLRKDESAREEWKSTKKLINDPRIIRGIGTALRRWSLDELPQLLNVLRGGMSLVGPRPMLFELPRKW